MSVTTIRWLTTIVLAALGLNAALSVTPGIRRCEGTQTRPRGSGVDDPADR